MGYFRHFASICDVCLREVPGRTEEIDADVYLVRECPVHGRREFLVSHNGEDYLRYDRFRLETLPAAGADPEPSKTFFFITPNCNQGCTYCLNEANEYKYFDDYDTDRFASDLAATAGTKIALVGGEPFSHPRFFEFARLVHAQHKVLQVYTNGLALADPALVQRLVDVSGGDCEIYITFEGFEPNLYEHVGAGRVRERKLAALENLRKFGLATTFHQTVPSRNYRDASVDQAGAAAAIVRYALDHSFVKAIAFQSIVAIGGARNLSADEVTSVDLTMDEILAALPIPVTHDEVYATQKLFALLNGVLGTARCPHLQLLVLLRLSGAWVSLDHLLDCTRLTRRLDRRLRGRPWTRTRMLWVLLVDTLAAVRWRRTGQLLRVAWQILPVFRGGLDASKIPRHVLPIAASTVCDRFNYDRDLVHACDKTVYSRVGDSVIAELATDMSLRQMRQRAAHEDDSSLRMRRRPVVRTESSGGDHARSA